MLKTFYIILQTIVYYESTKFCQAEPMFGEEVRKSYPDEYPFVVSINWKKNTSELKYPEKTHFCGGTLITRKHVITAAYCKQAELDKVVVKAGYVDLRNTDQYDVKSWITYDEWALENNVIPEYQDNDISIIELAKKVPDIKPAVLSQTEKSELYGKVAVTAGWGHVENDRIPRIMRIAKLNVISPRMCEKLINEANNYTFWMELTPNYLCTNSKPFMGCGDGGSPLFIGQEIIGVTESVCPYPGLTRSTKEQKRHMSVDFYADFISSVIECEKSNWRVCGA